MHTKEWPGRYHLNRYIHEDICRTYDVEIDGCQRVIEAEHNGLELWHVREGSQSLKIAGREINARAGEMFIFNAREPHTEQHFGDRKCRADVVVIRTDWLKSITDDLGFEIDEIAFKEILSKPSKALMGSLKDLLLLRQTPHASSVSVDCMASAVSLNILQSMEHRYSQQIRLASSQGRFPSAFLKAKSVMREMAMDDVADLNDVAKLSGLSKFHFLRVFRDSVGITPMQYLANLKVDKAKYRLLDSKDSIIETAFELGYQDLSTFNKSFKRHTGISPSHYRRLHGKK